MNLTEPHCGTDLGLMRTKAEPQDGWQLTRFQARRSLSLLVNTTWRTTSSTWYLAKITMVPEGIKGVSLFIVPKFMVNEDGSLGARNGGNVGSIEEKMGIHGNSTCVMNYDERDRLLVGR